MYLLENGARNLGSFKVPSNRTNLQKKPEILDFCSRFLPTEQIFLPTKQRKTERGGEDGQLRRAMHSTALGGQTPLTIAHCNSFGQPAQDLTTTLRNTCTKTEVGIGSDNFDFANFWLRNVGHRKFRLSKLVLRKLVLGVSAPGTRGQ